MDFTVLKTIPHIENKIWGGSKLSQYFTNKEKMPIGEVWSVSRLEQGSSLTESGRLADLTDKDQLPYLIKVIDTDANLSIQVHPDDEFAKAHENSSGKTECWIILDSKPGAKIYLGFKPGVDKNQFEKSIRNGEDVSSFLNSFEAKRGQFYFVPSGTIHAIGAGITLAEVQQSSGVTYRVWDWNRLDKNGNSRELHIDKALSVLRFDDSFNNSEYFKLSNDLFSEVGKKKIIDHKDFIIECGFLNVGQKLDLINSERLGSILVLNGKLTISCDEKKVSLSKYESAVVSNNKSKIITSTKESIFLYIY